MNNPNNLGVNRNYNGNLDGTSKSPDFNTNSTTPENQEVQNNDGRNKKIGHGALKDGSIWGSRKNNAERDNTKTKNDAESEKKYDTYDVLDAIEVITPNPEDFKPNPKKHRLGVYSSEEVDKDIQYSKDYEGSDEYSHKIESATKSKVLEASIIYNCARHEWFSDKKIYGKDSYMRIFPTSKIDDTFNHTDAVGVIRNSSTSNGYQAFAIDVTYNEENLFTKIGEWKHAYGKRDNVKDNESEFGSSKRVTKYDGRTETFTYRRNRGEKKGLKIPGFTSIKYFEDKIDKNHPIGKGRLKVIPRFVVGYSPEVANELCHMEESERDSYEKAKMYARWCTAKQCAAQAKDLIEMVQKVAKAQSDELKARRNDFWKERYSELSRALQGAVTMGRYFANVTKQLQKEADGNPLLQEAITDAESGPMMTKIIETSKTAYKEFGDDYLEEAKRRKQSL